MVENVGEKVSDSNGCQVDHFFRVRVKVVREE